MDRDRQTEADRQTDRQTEADKQAGRQVYREKDQQIGRQGDRQV